MDSTARKQNRYCAEKSQEKCLAAFFHEFITRVTIISISTSLALGQEIDLLRADKLLALCKISDYYLQSV